MPGRSTPWSTRLRGSPRAPGDARSAALPRAGLRGLVPASFGAPPSGERLARVLRSPHFVDGAFRNPVPTRRMAASASPLPMLRAQFAADRRRRVPAGRVPLHATTGADLAAAPASGLRLTWTGHASVLAEIDGRRVLFDPVWGERCSPFRQLGPRRLHPVPIGLAELGPIDVVVVSHDHYDHLDMPSIRALTGSGAVFAVPLGVGAHLEFWGVPAERIVELDWHESADVAGLTLTATPARHYCSRGPRTSPHLLWASWVVAGPRHRVFHSGDTGYFPGFADIGREHGPFDAAMVQIGAYSDFWPEVHMTPEEGVRAHLDLRGGLLLPIHWGTFNLAPHPWEEPAERTVAAALAADVALTVPTPGLPFEPASPPPLEKWWRDVAAAPERVPAPAPVRAPAPVAATVAVEAALEATAGLSAGLAAERPGKGPARGRPSS